MRFLDSSETSNEYLLIWKKINILNNEINLLENQIDLFPCGSVAIDYEAEMDGIIGIYKVVKNFDLSGTFYDRKSIKTIVKTNNKLVLKRYKLEQKALEIEEQMNYIKGNSKVKTKKYIIGSEQNEKIS